MDIKEKVVTLSTEGTFSSRNTVVDVPQAIITTNGQYKSGKIIDITVVIDGINQKPNLDLIFFPDKPTTELTFDQLKNCSGRVSIISEDFVDVGKCSIANLFNVNMTFMGKELYMITLYQGGNALICHKDSVSISLGYELGNCG